MPWQKAFGGEEGARAGGGGGGGGGAGTPWKRPGGVPPRAQVLRSLKKVDATPGGGGARSAAVYQLGAKASPAAWGSPSTRDWR